MQENRRIVLAERPRYWMPTFNCFRLESGPVPEPGSGEVLLRTLWLSLEPYMYGRMKRASSQAEPVALGDVMVGATVGRVERSNHDGFREGELVIGFWGWQDYALSDGSRLRKLASPVELEHPSYALGVLGRSSGLAAFVALQELARPANGETVVVGTATGGLGQIAGQIAKLRGCRAVGIAGGEKKCRFAVEALGYDACISRTADDFPEQLRAACSDGIDSYIETVGGKVFEAVLPLLNINARMVVLGLMETYTATGLPKGPDRTMVFLNQIIFKRLQVFGLVGNDYYERLFDAFQEQMGAWIASGEVKPVEHIVESLEEAPRALQGIFEGRNFGKVVVRVGA